MKKLQTFKLYGIFGYPLSHSLSPAMQEAAFRSLGIEAHYLVLELGAAFFKNMMKEAPKLLLSGFNVTVPYKETVLKYVDTVLPEAKAIGAVNTVFRKGKKLIGTNTDMEGFLLSLAKEGKFQPKRKKAVILGSGGAARAIVYGLSKKGIKEIALIDRVPSKAKKIMRDFGQIFPKVDYKALKSGQPQIKKHIEKADLVVNATGVGLKKGDSSVIPLQWIPKARGKKKLFFDLIYNPQETNFLKAAEKHGHQILNGIGMLVYQGARAFEYWTHKKAPVAVMRKALLAALKPKRK